MDNSIFRMIPKMDRILEMPKVVEASEGLPRAIVREALQKELECLRARLSAGEALPDTVALEGELAEAVRNAGKYRLQRVINATGVVLHTNLGRAPLGEAISSHVCEIAEGYSTLEYDLESGSRGSRHAIVEEQLCRLTGAEAAMVVNNNAAAVFLMLNTLASGKQVVVSRGELVEIGGSFRIPEIMSASGAALCEVGTTNKTHPGDYENAVTVDTGAILKVHTSNFRIVGFTQEAGIEELSGIAQANGLPLLYDLGSAFLIRPEALGLHDGIYVPDAVRYADVCCFSGDKLFGSGQAGILLGKRTYIERMKHNQLSRMLRVDKMTLAAIEAALRLYTDADAAKAGIPVLRMLSATAEELDAAARKLTFELSALRPDMRFEVVRCTDEAGGGSLPAVELEGRAVTVTVPGLSAKKLECMLRHASMPVIARISQDHLLLSVRTLLPEDIEALEKVIAGLEVNG